MHVNEYRKIVTDYLIMKTRFIYFALMNSADILKQR